ncbi:hypothetical protein OQ279_14255 [Salinimicrobium sp. MT39]|uniref:Uncharacterized protein n=1 Tax=Salinimicrobium profundisediminis TaxID=2994553 RepID=A0A9X3CZ95_9FLAO|nr:hypothetical protein [Salinimicrobium profundisediminis]MCX2839313.1 hypothetical protein [Salinimicrobium profundisediminis]
MIFLLMTGGMFAQDINLSEARMLYDRAVENEEAAERLLKISEANTFTNPVMMGYKAAGHMMMAKYVGNPFKKMSHFNKGKDILGTAIAADKNNLELRFLRFAVQAEAPGFLGYRDNLDEDKRLLLNGVGNIKDPVLQNMILKYLKTSKGLTTSEKEKLD